MPNVGLVELQDAETGKRIVVDTRSAQARELYAELNQKAALELQQVFRSSQVDSVNIRTDESYVLPLVRFFRQRAARD